MVIYFRCSGKRVSQSKEKWFSVAFQLGNGPHFFVTFLRARYNNFRAASSLGNEPRVLMILRKLMWTDSIALVV